MYPSYLNLSKKEFNFRLNKFFNDLEDCQICPRKCRVNRLKGEKGFCKLGELPMISAHHPHFGEERPLVGPSTSSGQAPSTGASTEPFGSELRTNLLSRTSSGQVNGSGTIFFTSCNLACVYCQNYEISQLRIGEEISFERLATMMLNLQNLGCHNINLVTPTPQVPQIVKALSIAIEKGLKLPLVYNTSCYDSVEILKLLDGIVDIYMPDTKYSDLPRRVAKRLLRGDKIALKYSLAPNYFEIMKKAIKEMHRQVGDLVLNKEGIADRGLLVRHLILPNNLAGSEKIFKFLAKEISKNTFLNIMDQYFPHSRAQEFPELSRPITKEEFQEAIELAKKAGLKRLYPHTNGALRFAQIK